MSNAEDIAAIQARIGNDSSQIAAVVAACATLDDDTKAKWYDLAGRVQRYVSEPVASIFNDDQLARGRALRGEQARFSALLTAKGCGDVAALIAKAGPPVMAPPPKGTPNPLLSIFDGAGGLLVLGIALYVMSQARGSRRNRLF